MVSYIILIILMDQTDDMKGEISSLKTKRLIPQGDSPIEKNSRRINLQREMSEPRPNSYSDIFSLNELIPFGGTLSTEVLEDSNKIDFNRQPMDHISSLRKINSSHKLFANSGGFENPIIEKNSDPFFIDAMENIIEYKYAMQIEKAEYENSHTGDHLIFSGNENGVFSFFIITAFESGYNGYKMGANGPSHFLIIMSPSSKTVTRRSLITNHKKIKANMKKKYPKVKFNLITNTQIINPLLQFEKEFICDIKTLQIGITYFDGDNNEAMKMVESPRKITGSILSNFYYNQFLDALGVIHSEDKTIHDIYRGVKICWYDALKMNEETIRQYIGNINFMIIYNGSNTPITTKSLTIFGKVVQFFLIIKRVAEKKYRLSFAGKVPQFPPITPDNVIFDENNLRDFVIPKAHNSMIQVKYNSEIKSLHTIPAQTRLNEIAKKHRTG